MATPTSVHLGCGVGTRTAPAPEAPSWLRLLTPERAAPGQGKEQAGAGLYHNPRGRGAVPSMGSLHLWHSGPGINRDLPSLLLVPGVTAPGRGAQYSLGHRNTERGVWSSKCLLYKTLLCDPRQTTSFLI